MFRPAPPRQRPRNLNAIAPQAHDEEAECRARHRIVCQELIDLGLQLARNAARRALDEAEPDPLPETTPDLPEPPRRARRYTDPNLTFTRMSCAVRQAVKLEAQIVARTFDRPARAGAARRPEPDFHDIAHAVDQGLLTDGLQRLTEAHPDRWNLNDTIEAAVEETFLEHPQDPLPTHFARACRILGLTADFATFPHHLAAALRPRTLPDG